MFVGGIAGLAELMNSADAGTADEVGAGSGAEIQAQRVEKDEVVVGVDAGSAEQIGGKEVIVLVGEKKWESGDTGGG
jgi:hypothetical protein